MIIFVTYVSCLSCFLVCLLQPCGQLLGMAKHVALLYVMFNFVFVTFPYGQCPESSVILDCIDS